MGYYINKLKDGTDLPANGKAEFLVKNANAVKVSGKEFCENLVCVVDNRLFEAAGYCFSKEEFEAFKYPDGRSKQWLIVPDAKEIAE